RPRGPRGSATRYNAAGIRSSRALVADVAMRDAYRRAGLQQLSFLLPDEHGEGSRNQDRSQGACAHTFLQRESPRKYALALSSESEASQRCRITAQMGPARTRVGDRRFEEASERRCEGRDGETAPSANHGQRYRLVQSAATDRASARRSMVSIVVSIGDSAMLMAQRLQRDLATAVRVLVSRCDFLTLRRPPAG